MQKSPKDKKKPIFANQTTNNESKITHDTFKEFSVSYGLLSKVNVNSSDTKKYLDIVENEIHIEGRASGDLRKKLINTPSSSNELSPKNKNDSSEFFVNSPQRNFVPIPTRNIK